MNLRDVEENLASIEGVEGVDLLYELLAAYGLPKASISRLRSGSYDKSEREDERLWKGKVYFRACDAPDEELLLIIDAAKNEERILRERPRFLVVRNEEKLLARDTETGASLDTPIADLGDHAAFFLPWAGIEKTQLENLNLADVKAAEKMAKLYDEVIKHNEIEPEEEIHDLNVFFSRLLFCFFAEDTGVFEEGSFTNAIGSLTRESGEDTHEFLDQLFEVLDTEPAQRDDVPSHLRGFGYVNGNLFGRRSEAPRFTAKARAVVLECGTLDWSQINPDIFGSMIQAVVHPGQRAGLGMHYTSVENIMKVIRPLFLDELEEAFRAADTVRKLDRLLERIASIQIFDPACGSGNFLVIAYKELRRLEHRILQRISELEPGRSGLFKFSSIELDNFYGIEIDDFAHEIAILSLWLAKHQMNREFEALFGAEIPLIPLVEAGDVRCGNAARMEWGDVCDDGRTRETYVLGNPPYLGANQRTKYQSDDLRIAIGADFDANLDYIAAWFVKGARYVADNGGQVGFVSTNSVCQGLHVSALWPILFEAGIEISFAHTSFPWANQARGRAGITVIVVGMSRVGTRSRKQLATPGGTKSVAGIGPYLSPGPSRVIVSKSSQPISAVPVMVKGSQPTDGGHLVLSPEERLALLGRSPAARPFIRRFMGASDLLRDDHRFCIWIDDHEVTSATAVPVIAERIEKVRAYRLSSKRAGTRGTAEWPWRFQYRPHRAGHAVILPIHSSERRDYIPMGFVDESTVISNAANAIYDAELWLFGLVHSRMHMAWVRAVAGRLKTDIRYSAVLVYNTFPVPEIMDPQRESLTERAIAVLAAREQFPDSTLAELYDPDKMPGGLRQAHTDLDEAVDRLYRARGFDSDEDRLRLLFEMYEAATDDEGKPIHA